MHGRLQAGGENLNQPRPRFWPMIRNKIKDFATCLLVFCNPNLLFFIFLGTGKNFLS
jgi:hypothetical protein